MPIAGNVAAITGASSGLGAEMARQLARSGYKVGLTARRLDELEKLAASIRGEGGTAFVAPADASDPDALRSALAGIAAELGPVDLLIANAGIGGSTTAMDFSAEAVERLVRVNLLGVAYAIESVLPAMIDRKRGQIVGISSLAGYRGVPGSAAYSASKAGLTALLESLRPELRSMGIAMTVVHPGYVRTPMTDRLDRPMPFLMDVEPAARLILRGVARRKRRVDFPWPMVGLLFCLRLLPGAIYDPIAARMVMRRSTERQ